MGLIGKKVQHNKFGEGLITEQDASYVSVKFMSEPETKRFQYPSCFKTFLKLLDADAAVKTDEAVKRYEEEERQKKQQEMEEAEARRFAKKMQENSGKSNKTVELRLFNSVDGFCDEYIRAITSEVVYLKNTGGKRQRIFDGKRVEFKNGRYVYTFEADDELKYPEGTQISIWQGQASIPGHIVGCEDFTIILASSADLGADVPALEFSAEPWRLLNALIERLDDMRNNPSGIVKALICDGQKSIDYGNSRITRGQQEAVKMSKNQPITFVWGPPGTGKTQTLAKIALAHIEQGSRVLMLSYSNVSVDGAIMRVYKMSSHTEPGLLVRYGYARRKDLLEHEYLTSYNLAIHNHPELLCERRDLIAERKRLSRTSQRYVEIGRRLTQIKNELSFEEKETVRKAKFVATTVSKAVVDSAVRDSRFDVVIFDEASMAYIPQIVFSASLAKKHFICMGDFRQLPPIVQSSGTSPLNADIFQYCGITSAVDSGRNHKWLCMLDTQYRMHPRISDFASQTMYGGLLRSAEDMEKNRQNVAAQNPAAGYAIAFADLSGMMSVCTKTGDNSRVNVLSALMSFSLALEAAKTQEVGIITPYHAQSRLLHTMARDIAEVNPELKPISCATVHQFQGSEKDVIVYDAVDCYRMPYPGMLLTSTGNNYANRLFNVALTRAKGKFIGVANVAYMDNKNLSKNLMFERMIETQRRKQSCLKGTELTYQRKSISGSPMSFFDNNEGTRQFLSDIAAAQREIRIDIPDKPVDDAYARQLATGLQTAKGKGITVFVRAENKQSLPVVLKPLAIENPFVANPVVLIDKKIVWFGLPASDAKFKSEGSILQTNYRPVIRFVGKYTASSLYGFMEMSKTVDQSNSITVDDEGKAVTENFASYVLANKKCPSCGKPMKLQKSKKGKFFLGCTGYPACQETSLVDVDLVERYFYRNGGTGQHCARCNCSLEAKLGPYGLYIQCCGSMHHKYKLDEI
jgi:hypothetical protein